MKVISQPDVSGWSYHHTCSKCETQLEVEAKDLHHYHHTASFGDPSYDSYTTECVICSQSFTVPIDNIPKLIQVETQKKSFKGSYYDR